MGQNTEEGEGPIGAEASQEAPGEDKLALELSERAGMIFFADLLVRK